MYASRAELQPFPSKHHISTSFDMICESQTFSTEASKLFLHHLRTVIFGRVTHHLRLVDWGLAVPVRIRCAVRRTLSAAFDEDMPLFVQSASCYQKTKNCCQLLQLESDRERTFNASFREKLFSQCPQGKGFTAKWIRLWRFRSWLRLKDCGHWSHLNGRSFCGCCCPGCPYIGPPI